MNESSNDRLTTNAYWDVKYEDDVRSSGTHTVSPNINLATSEVDRYFKRHLLHDTSFRFIEIGCAPGSWMHYFKNVFGYKPEGIEYTHKGVRSTRHNLRLLGIEPIVYEQDLFDNTLDKETYDVVFSSGFIEHFSDPQEAIAKHVELLRKGGILILKIPNLQGMNYRIQKWLDQDILDKHNLGIMNLKYFHGLVGAFDIEELDVSYVGKINFALFIGKRVFMLPLHGLQALLSVLYFPFKSIGIHDRADRSPYIIGIYRKR